MIPNVSFVGTTRATCTEPLSDENVTASLVGEFSSCQNIHCIFSKHLATSIHVKHISFAALLANPRIATMPTADLLSA